MRIIRSSGGRDFGCRTLMRRKNCHSARQEHRENGKSVNLTAETQRRREEKFISLRLCGSKNLFRGVKFWVRHVSRMIIRLCFCPCHHSRGTCPPLPPNMSKLPPCLSAH